MKHCFLSAFVFLIFTGTVLSQTDFRKGYIVGSTKDTTFGFIDYKGNMANAKYCLFKSDAGSAWVPLASTTN